MKTQEIKELLNSVNLLRFVKKYSCDNLLEDNKMATEKFKVETNPNSISILDNTACKLFVSNSKFSGNEVVRFSLKQLQALLDVAGVDGEMVIAKSNLNELIAEVKNDVIIVCPIPKSDKKTDED